MRARLSLASRHALVVFALALALYLPFASFAYVQSVDTEAAATPAWSIAWTGTPDVSSVPRRDERFYFEHDGGVYSNRFPGVVLYGVPFYAVARALSLDHVWAPGAVAGAVATAGAVAVMFVLLTRILASASSAWLSTLFFAFGTATWAVSADAQWPHGINQLLIAAGVLMLASNRLSIAGLLLGLTVLVRPQMAPGVLALGLVLLIQRRSWKDFVSFGGPALGGAIALITYHGLVLDRWTVGNGHTDYAAGDNAAASLLALPANLIGTLLDPTRGVIFLYPVILVAALGVRQAWITGWPWEKAAGIAGAVVLVTQLSLNRYSGGDAFFGSRVTIEALTLAYPLMTKAWTLAPNWSRRIGIPLLAWSVVVHAVGAVSYPYLARDVFPYQPTVIVTVCLALAAFAMARALSSRLDPSAGRNMSGQPQIHGLPLDKPPQ